MKNFAFQNRVLWRDRVLERRVLEREYCIKITKAKYLHHDQHTAVWLVHSRCTLASVQCSPLLHWHIDSSCGTGLARVFEFICSMNTSSSIVDSCSCGTDIVLTVFTLIIDNMFIVRVGESR